MTKPSESNVVSISRVESNRQTEARLKELGDDELMRLSSTDVKEAFAELVLRHRLSVLGYCRKWDADRGDDAAQDVFVRLWRFRHQYNPRNDFKSYLFTIVVNQCRNVKRGLLRKPPMEALSSDHAACAVSAKQLDLILEKERLGRVHRHIQKLSPKLKETVLLRFGQDLSYRQIAEIIGVNEATVRARALLGIEKLRKEL